MSLFILWRMAARGLALHYFLWAQREMRRAHIDEGFVALKISEYRRAIARDYDEIRTRLGPRNPRRPGR